MNPAAAAALANPELLSSAVKLQAGITQNAIQAQGRAIRVAVTVVAVIVLVILLIIFIPKIKSFFNRGTNAVNAAALNASISQNNLSYPKAQYTIFADNLETAFNGMGTDEETVFSIFSKMNTYDDVSQLIVSFGVRTITDPRPWISNKDLTLPQAIKDEMDSPEQNKINVTLAGKGINYSF